VSIAVFNINDAGIQVSVDGDLIRTSPGYAVLDGSNLLTGEEASQNAKLLPRWTNNRFWSQLNVNPLPNGNNQIRHHADLAFAHLEALWQPIAASVESAVFVVPGYYGNDNLGLLLGMSQEASIPVRGIVDSSIIQAADLPLRKTVLHLDIHLHSITLTNISNTGTLARRDVKTVIESGFFTLLDRWSNIIADQFIQTTRFDPMHNADTEQQLFNKLPAWIVALSEVNAHPISLNAGDTEHSVSISNDSLLKACASIYPQIVQAIRNEVPAGETATLLVSHRFTGFPGLKNSLGLINNVEVVDLAELKAIGSASVHQGEIVVSDGPVQHVLQISAGSEQSSLATMPSSAQATHLLWQHRAFAIGTGIKLGDDLSEGPRATDNPVCTLYRRNQQLVLETHREGAVQLNGIEAKNQETVNLGDILTIGSQPLTVISVTSDG
jgi:hypothetical protein